MRFLARLCAAFLSIVVAGLLSSFGPFDSFTNSPIYGDRSPYPIVAAVLNEQMVPIFDDVRSLQPLSVSYRVTTHNPPTIKYRGIVDEPLTRLNLLQHEGRRHRAYTDSTGHRTIGIGSNLDADGAISRIKAIGANYNRIRAGLDILTDRQIDLLFDKDLTIAIEAAHRLVPGFEDKPLQAQCVIIDLCFNLGATGFSQLRTFRAAMARNAYGAAARALEQSTWYNQVGPRAEEAVRLLKSTEVLRMLK